MAGDTQVQSRKTAEGHIRQPRSVFSMRKLSEIHEQLGRDLLQILHL